MFTERLDQWIQEVGFVEGDGPGTHGHISRVSPSSNGSSGAKVEREYLEPLGLTSACASFTDVYPVFVVKRSTGTQREQGDAIDHEYNQIAASLGLSISSLPGRPTPKRLVRDAVETFRERLLEDLKNADPDLVVTLGDEAMQVVRAVADLRPKHAAESLVDLYGNRYGEPGTVKVNQRRVEWIPLAHPGLLKGEPKCTDTSTGGRSLAGLALVTRPVEETRFAVADRALAAE